MRFLLVCLIALSIPTPAGAQKETILLVAATTSTDNSGLLRYLIPKIENALGFAPRFVITGSGNALRLGGNRDVDVLWVHDAEGEQKFMAQGHGARRESLMFNHFILVGPASDPAGVGEAETIIEALERIMASGSLFVSRGDDSGTHRRERQLWSTLDADHPVLHRVPLNWYRELGSGMGATLNSAAAMEAYTLVDEATWLQHAHRGNHALLFTDDIVLRNPYSVIVVKGSGREAATDAAHRLVDWLISPEGQDVIAAYRIAGQQGFFPTRQ